MNHPKNATIILLTTAAAIMTAMLILSWTQTQQPAHAVTTMKGGDYVVCTAQVTDTQDVLYVLDIAAGTLKAYAVYTKEGGPGLIRDVGTVNVAQLFRAGR